MVIVLSYCFWLLLFDVRQVGQPTILVNNAGVAQGKLLLDLEPEDVKQSV